jgi:hypothetical protein
MGFGKLEDLSHVLAISSFSSPNPSSDREAAVTAWYSEVKDCKTLPGCTESTGSEQVFWEGDRP